MKVKNKKSIYNILPIFGLVFILLLSPCKVRNFIQVKLGVPQTEVSNKNKSTIKSSNCSNLEITTNYKASKKDKSQQALLIPTCSDIIFSTIEVQLSTHLNESSKKTTTVPLYILYKNFKDYL